ncbi:MAG: hypothetical protein ACR2NN_04355 [Bryobacteraceae bacterium]
MRPERADDGAQLSIIQFSTARRGPRFGFQTGCAESGLSGSMQGFFGMEPIEDLDAERTQVL